MPMLPTNLLTFLLNPRTLLAIAAIAFTIWLSVILYQNNLMKTELEAQQDQIVQLEEQAEVLKLGQELQAADLARLDQIAQYRQTVVIREQQLEDDLQDIPETIDTPFADPNNLAYAQRLREYQEQTLNGLAAD